MHIIIAATINNVRLFPVDDFDSQLLELIAQFI